MPRWRWNFPSSSKIRQYRNIVEYGMNENGEFLSPRNGGHFLVILDIFPPRHFLAPGKYFDRHCPFDYSINPQFQGLEFSMLFPDSTLHISHVESGVKEIFKPCISNKREVVGMTTWMEMDVKLKSSAWQKRKK